MTSDVLSIPVSSFMTSDILSTVLTVSSFMIFDVLSTASFVSSLVSLSIPSSSIIGEIQPIIGDELPLEGTYSDPES